eukprot:4030993-Lingulodinium_polyedra.AAC.1
MIEHNNALWNLVKHTGSSSVPWHPMAGWFLLQNCLGAAWVLLGRRLAGACVLLDCCLGAGFAP